MSRFAIKCLGLSKDFGPVRAVTQLDLEVPQGEILTLLGPSGCGKTTVLRLIAGFEKLDSGSVEIGGNTVSSRSFSIPPEKRSVGFVFQDYALFPHLNVWENVRYGVPRTSEFKLRMEDIFSLMRLGGVESRYPHELSGGQQQRVALARALAPKPRMLLLDEPLSNLDSKLRIQIRNEMKDVLKEEDVTVVWVTHDQDEALVVGDTMAIMKSGRIEQKGDPETVFHHPSTTFVARFLGTADFIAAQRQSGGVLEDLDEQAWVEKFIGNSRFEVMVRPDDIKCAPSESGRGTITDRVFLGPTYLYRIALSSGESVHSMRPYTERYEIGTQVDVTLAEHWSPSYFTDGRLVSGTTMLPSE